jgi:DNA-binding MarR family transcriptional regulator
MNEYTPNNNNNSNMNIHHGMHHTSHDYEDINKRCCCFSMRKVSRAVTQYFDGRLENVGIRSTQFSLLAALASTSAKTLTEIAESLVMDRTTLTRNLKPLEKMELITTVVPIDRRSKGYTLTPKGREVLDKAIVYWKEAQDAVVHGLTNERYAALQKELQQVLNVTSSLKYSPK